MVPLDETHAVLDWMSALGCRCCWDRQLCRRAQPHADLPRGARAARLAVKALVINETPGSTVTLADTMMTLKRFMSMPMIGLTRASDPAAFKKIAELL